MKIALHEMEPWLIEYQSAPYNLGESGVLDQTLGDVLDLGRVSPEQLLQISLSNGDTRGSAALRELISDLYAGATPGSVLVTTGTSEALFIYFSLRYTPGANVVVPLPSFQSLYEVPRYLGYEVRLLRLRREDGFRLDLDALADLVDDSTRAIVINNPHNPTGVRLTESEVARILAIAERHGADVLADEHYRFLPYGDESVIPSLYGQSEAVIAVGSMIKCAGCVGLRVGWMLGPASFLAECRDFRDYTTHTLCPINDFVAQTVLRQLSAITGGYARWISANLERFEAVVAELPAQLEWNRPQAGVVAFPYLKRERSARDFSRELVEATGVFVLPGDVFEMPSHFRIGFGIRPASFDQAMAHLSEFLGRR